MAPSGNEKVIHSLRLQLELNPTHVVEHMDVKNAFNTMSREAFLSALGAHPTLQALLPLACQFYIEPSRLLVRRADNSFVELVSESGRR